MENVIADILHSPFSIFHFSFFIPAANRCEGKHAMSNNQSEPSGNRVMSIDAYRGFVMLAMASSGFGFSTLAKPENLQKLADSHSNPFPNWLLKGLAYQFDHVAWAGCGFWDLIQPSFMFLVGVSLPFSYSRRERDGESAAARWRHV